MLLPAADMRAPTLDFIQALAPHVSMKFIAPVLVYVNTWYGSKSQLQPTVAVAQLKPFAFAMFENVHTCRCGSLHDSLCIV